MFDAETADFGEYRASYSPAFLSKVREKQRQAKIAEQTKALAERRRREQELREATQAEVERARRERDAERKRAVSLRAEIDKARQAENEEYARKLLDDAERRIRSDALASRAIIEAISVIHNVSYQQIIGRSRAVHIVEARHAAIAEVRRQRPHLSTIQIGRLFGGRDHSTICHALQKMEARSTQPKEG
jgi:chromosomal replication initiation ATPase DnaA